MLLTPRSLAELRAHARLSGVRCIGTGVLAGHVGVFDGDEPLVTTAALQGVVAEGEGWVRVRAGEPVASLDEHLASSGQHCPLDPWWPGATVGGVVAAGIPGHRRLRYGDVRHQVLSVLVVTHEGELIELREDALRDVVGAFGQSGLIAEVTLRTLDAPTVSMWLQASGPVRVPRVSSHLCTPNADVVLVEGDHAARSDCATHRPAVPATVREALIRVAAPIWAPAAAQITLTPRRGTAFVRALPHSTEWVLEPELGRVHVSSADPDEIDHACELAGRWGGRPMRYHPWRPTPAGSTPLQVRELGSMAAPVA